MFLRKITIASKNGTIKKNRRDELHNQLPPESSIDRFKIKVTAKNMEAIIPIAISLIKNLSLRSSRAICYTFGTVYYT